MFARWVGLAGVGVLLFAVACAPENEPTTTGSGNGSGKADGDGTSASAERCAKDELQTYEPGTLTIATDQPVYEPWFVNDKPENGKGFEGAVAYAVAEQMGYDKSEVTWTRVRFNNAIQPGPKDFDFDINEFTISEKRKQAVDFSSPYYNATQAVIAPRSSKAAGAKSLADLAEVKLGAQVNTTSYDVIDEVIQPSVEPEVFPNNDNAKRALQNGSIDGLVLDLPTAFYMTSAEIEDSLIVGQVELASGEPEQFGLVLDKGSPLTSCVSAAVDELRKDGTLDTLADEWLANVADAPVLE